jgi:hypothetical protein
MTLCKVFGLGFVLVQRQQTRKIKNYMMTKPAAAGFTSRIYENRQTTEIFSDFIKAA